MWLLKFEQWARLKRMLLNFIFPFTFQNSLSLLYIHEVKIPFEESEDGEILHFGKWLFSERSFTKGKEISMLTLDNTWKILISHSEKNEQNLQCLFWLPLQELAKCLNTYLLWSKNIILKTCCKIQNRYWKLTSNTKPQFLGGSFFK